MAAAICKTPLRFFGTFVCTSKGYVERAISLPSLERVVVFVTLLNVSVRGRYGGKLLSISLKKERGTYSGLALLASQK